MAEFRKFCAEIYDYLSMSRVPLASAECKISARQSRVTGHAEQFELVQYLDPHIDRDPLAHLNHLVYL